MYDELQDKDYFTKKAENWRKELEEQKPGSNILNYDNDTLGIILYTLCIFEKFCPYDNYEWIYEY